MNVLLDIITKTTKDSSIFRKIEKHKHEWIGQSRRSNKKIALFVDYVIQAQTTEKGNKLTASNLIGFCCQGQDSQTFWYPRTRWWLL